MFIAKNGLGLHVIKNPAGTFSYVGSIPRELGEKVKPSTSDIMAGRFYTEGDKQFTTKFPSFTSRQAAVKHAASGGFTVKD